MHYDQSKRRELYTQRSSVTFHLQQHRCENQTFCFLQKVTILVNLFIYLYIPASILLPFRANYFALVLLELLHFVAKRQQQKYKTRLRVYTSLAKIFKRKSDAM
jgi:hypothetical protein